MSDFLKQLGEILGGFTTPTGQKIGGPLNTLARNTIDSYLSPEPAAYRYNMLPLTEDKEGNTALGWPIMAVDTMNSLDRVMSESMGLYGEDGKPIRSTGADMINVAGIAPLGGIAAGAMRGAAPAAKAAGKQLAKTLEPYDFSFMGQDAAKAFVPESSSAITTVSNALKQSYSPLIPSDSAVNGVPFRAYHGSKSPGSIDQFDIENAKDLGIHFGSLENAELYAGSHPWQWSPNIKQTALSPEGGKIYPVDITFQNMLDYPNYIDDAAKGPVGSRMVSRMGNLAYALEKNGVVKFTPEELLTINAGNRPTATFDDLEKFFASNAQARDRWETLDPVTKSASDVIRQKLIDAGYDGIRYHQPDVTQPHEGGTKYAYMALRPGTVKSATTGETLFSNSSNSATAPLALNALEQQSPDNIDINELLRRYGMMP